MGKLDFVDEHYGNRVSVCLEGIFKPLLFEI